MKNLVTLYIGLFDKDTHQQEYPIENFIKVINDYFSCYTLTQFINCYKYEDGTIVDEPSLKVEFIDSDLTFDTSIIELIKDRLNQEYIMVTVQTLQVQFI